MKSAPHIVVAAGGTGGHIFPGLAAARELCNLAARVSWLGASESDRAFVEERRPQGVAVFVAPFCAPRGLWGLRRLPGAVFRAFALFWKLRPQAVLGFGGYAAVPGGLAARLMRVPLLVHEQNASAGRANRLLAPFAARVLTGFPGALKGGEWAGNPVRAECENIPPPAERYAKRKGALSILVLGGSQGAAALNAIVPAAIARAKIQAEVLHQCGAGKKEKAEDGYRNITGGNGNGNDGTVTVTVKEFIDDIGAAMAAADLLVCRAGASTLAEAAVVGVACFLIPYPYAAGGHQNGNAFFFSERGAAEVCAQEKAEERLAVFLQNANRARLLQMAQSARELAKPDAAKTVAAACMEEAEKGLRRAA